MKAASQKRSVTVWLHLYDKVEKSKILDILHRWVIMGLSQEINSVRLFWMTLQLIVDTQG